MPEKTSVVSSDVDGLQDLIKRRIEVLRPKLLDLSRRNPLIATKLSPRSSSHVRVVDELPDVLFANLTARGDMRFVALPALDEDPRDEQSREFQNALSESMIADEVWITSVEAIDQSSEESLEQYRKCERALKDRVREQLGMAPRQGTGETSLKQHAVINGISPSFDLPLVSEQHEDGRHQDADIQTLLLPDDLERKMNGLLTKCRTWIQETGIHVLYAAFGFLEWADPRTNDASFAPLVLISVDLEKVKTRHGLEFRVVGTGEEPETNKVLAEKLKHDFGLELPIFAGGSLEDYFTEVASQSPKGLSWKVRRQVVFGVFPSARIAMYHDLDTNTDFQFNEAVSKLLGGTSSETIISVYGDEYEVDHPEIESKVPHLVLDADSSQFSTMVDVANGKDLAVEGPPGTGKSQTIVNTIASVLNEGKKVLFVAEKLAALDVVKSRLEAIGLGEFILPLQAERSTREQVVQSIKDRIDMTPGRVTADLDFQIEKFKQTRADLQSYIDAISKLVGSTGLTVFDVIGKSIVLNDLVDSLPKVLQNPRVERVSEFNRSRIETIKDACNAVEATWKETLDVSGLWKGLTVLNVDRFMVDEICDLAETVANALREEETAAHCVREIGIDAACPIETIDSLRSALLELSPVASRLDLDVLARLVVQPELNAVFEFLSGCKRNQEENIKLGEMFSRPLSEDLVTGLQELHQLCVGNEIQILHVSRLTNEVLDSEKRLEELQAVHNNVKRFVDSFPESAKWSLVTFNKVADIIAATPLRVLAGRRETLSDPLAFDLIEQCAHRGRDLQKKRDQLESVMSVARVNTTTELLSTYIRSLNSANIFSGLMPDFRAAKKFYLSITRRQGFDKDVAAKDLSNLLDWKDQVAQLISNDRAVRIFGLDFGIDTDFDFYDELVSFYKAIDSTLSGLEYREVRSFLKTADLDVVRAVPRTVDGYEETAQEILSRIIVFKQEISRQKLLIDDLRDRCSVFSTSEQITVESLPKLAKRIRESVERTEQLERADNVKPILGKSFAGSNTSSDCIQDELLVLETLRKCGNDPSNIIGLLKTDTIPEVIAKLGAYVEKHRIAASLLSELSNKSGITIDELAARASACDVSGYLFEAAQDKRGLVAHSTFATAMDELAQQGFAWLVPALLNDGREITNLALTFEAVFYRALLRFIHSEHGGVLTKFNGRKLDECRERLAKLDREILELSRRHVRSKLHKIAKPPGGVGVGRKSEWTDMALIENELAKKKGFISVRELTHRAGRALLELKPCWMMSPLAVAQYLRKEQIVFDLVIIDEASQMPPEDALGALIRGRQVMVVGDTNQLPPTTFFRKLVDDDSIDQDEAVLEESILEMANAAFRPARRLRWHYRSRHSALINFSNQMVYNGNLIVFPSATEVRSDLGVSLVSVNGRYSSGVNGEEAKAMIDATVKFIKAHPDRSLGLVVLNQKQRDLLLEEWEYILTKEPAAARFVERWLEHNDGLESFFIKNLENVQGDERDVMFIGTVCGPEEIGGPVDHRSFGPINGLAGKRRLNVLFSRAKEQIVTFSSMTSADVRADENSNAGVYMLKKWLEYSAAGGSIHTGVQTNKAPDSDFEDYVIAQIRSMGCEPVSQVGVAGYFIDIGIRHPDWPHGYIMGVECDGASYHSSKSARDRDRLRQEVLERLGWHLHRIWSTDWFNDPRKQAERLREAISSRVSHLCSRCPAPGEITQGSALEDVALDEENADEFDEPDEDEFEEQEQDEHQAKQGKRSPEDVSAAEITESILAVLQTCPNNSCTVSSLTTRVLKTLGVLTRGKPRMRFKRRVMQSVTNLVYREVVERYRAKNERVRLVDSRQLRLLS